VTVAILETPLEKAHLSTPVIAKTKLGLELGQLKKKLILNASSVWKYS
jgi:mannose/fructose/N-acetylgalactosamine-specific phosphotransferase system component IIC